MTCIAELVLVFTVSARVHQPAARTATGIFSAMRRSTV